MRFYRSERVSSLIQSELGKILLKEIELPGALLTITEVDVSRKLDRAAVKVSVLPSEKAESALAELKKKTGYLQHLLMVRINIKPMPQIAFEIDYGMENAAVVEKLLLEEDE